jgi:hypothetical protein
VSTMTPDPAAPKPKAPVPAPLPDVLTVPQDTAGLDPAAVAYVELLETPDRAELNRLAFVLWANDDTDDDTPAGSATRKYRAVKMARTVLEYRTHWDEKRRPGDLEVLKKEYATARKL